MPDYKSMYFRLFNRVSAAIELLQMAQQEGENKYMEGDEPPIVLAVLNETPIEDSDETSNCIDINS